MFGTPSGGITPLEVDCRDFIDGVSITATLVSGCYVAEVDVDFINDTIEDYLNSTAGETLINSKIADYLASTEGCQAIITCAEANCDIDCNDAISPTACANNSPTTLCVHVIDPDLPYDNKRTCPWDSGLSEWTDGANTSITCDGDIFEVVIASGDGAGTYRFEGFGTKFFVIGGAPATVELLSGTCP